MGTTIISENPAIAKAAAIERERRQEAWLELEEPLLGKVHVKPLTLRHCLYLDLAQNWYVVGFPAPFDPSCSHKPEEYLKAQAYQQFEYLWVVSEDFKPGDEEARQTFLKSLGELDFIALDKAIREFHNAAFFDAPGSGGKDFGCPIVDWVAVIAHQFAAAYGWEYNKVLDTPLRILLQLRRCIAISNDPKAANTIGNPLSDAAKKELLDTLNQQRKAESDG